MTIGLLILSNQLFEKNNIIKELEKKDKIYLYEHPNHFTNFTYHKMKLVMHRSTMKKYYDFLIDKHKNIEYLEYNQDLEKILKKDKIKHLKVYNPIDHNIVKEYNNIKKKLNIELEIYDNPGFICKVEDYNSYLNESKNKYFHHHYYVWCRKKYNILMVNNKPIGDKWSFDGKNRLPFPKDYKVDLKIKKNSNNKYIKEAIQYIEKNFKNNHGEVNYYLPIDFKSAKSHLKKFIKERLENFGPYEDAVNSEIIVGNHSILSPIINIGLLTPSYILTELEKYKIKIESLEGYIRQLFWREYCAMVYLNKNDELIKDNFFNHKNKLSKSWYNATTPMFLINNLINKALKYGYCHHIERLMYLGNFMFLCEINPKLVYKWFMEMFIDAYEWVMIPNIYGMSQHSAGKLMMTRPYFSSSNYIDKMSNYTDFNNIISLNNNNYEWTEIWNSLYYNFISNNITYLKKNYSTAALVAFYNKKSDEDKKKYTNISRLYLNNYL